MIEPHLGALNHLQASQPHPEGRIDVELTRESTATRAHISLPHGVPGEFVWQEKTYPLHAGEQTISLPAH